jgi:DNA replication protein DnaC
LKCSPRIEEEITKRRTATAIYQDLVEHHGYTGSYDAVKRLARTLRKIDPKISCRFETEPGQEAQVDYGEGALTRDPRTGKYRRPRLFVMTLGSSRHAFRKTVWNSSTEVWCRLHEEAFAYFGASGNTSKSHARERFKTARLELSDVCCGRWLRRDFCLPATRRQAVLVHDELQRRRDRLIGRRTKAAAFRDNKTLDTFDWKFNTIDRALIFELANGRFIEQHEDVLLLGNAGVGKSHIAQAIGMAAIHAGFRVLYREAHVLFEELLEANAIGERAEAIATYSEIPLLIVDDLGMRKLPANAAEDLLEIVMRRYERASTILTSNRPLEDWPKLFGDTPAVAAFLDRLMHHSHLIEIRGKSYRLHEHSLTARDRRAKATTQ